MLCFIGEASKDLEVPTFFCTGPSMATSGPKISLYFCALNFCIDFYLLTGLGDGSVATLSGNLLGSIVVYLEILFWLKYGANYGLLLLGEA